jgi:2-oxoglutarate ferredoxin oxidoreductase subunit alpha
MAEYGILLSGAAGQGVQTVGGMLTRLAAASGVAVFAWQDNESRIRGGSNSFRVRISKEARNAPVSSFDVLLPLDGPSYAKYRGLLAPNGVLLGPEDRAVRNVAVDFEAIARSAAGTKKSANAAAFGALAAVLGFGWEPAAEALSHEFAGKPEALLSSNTAAAKAGFEAASAACKGICFEPLAHRVRGATLISGADAVALGAWAGGCRFIAAYPMSPSTAVITTLARFSSELGVFTEQAEDEIAAANMAIGAAYAGVRSMTATSGGGFALMTEAVSLAGMTEIPLVILIAQRPGPATGLPTRTEQGDLLFAIHAGHGEFAKAVLAPSDAKSAFESMVRAFDLSERFQSPVCVLTDQYLMDSLFTIEDFGIVGIQDRPATADPLVSGPYRRYALTDSGVSLRLAPVVNGPLVCCDSDEHDEEGHITEDLELRNRMVRKRLAKASALKKAIAPPETHQADGADVCLVGWGSTRNAMAEAADNLVRKGLKTGWILFSEVWPLPAFRFPRAKKYVAVEGNATGQFESLVRAEYGISFSGAVRRFDGLPIDADFITGRVP